MSFGYDRPRVVRDEAAVIKDMLGMDKQSYASAWKQRYEAVKRKAPEFTILGIRTLVDLLNKVNAEIKETEKRIELGVDIDGEVFEKLKAYKEDLQAVLDVKRDHIDFRICGRELMKYE